MAGLAIHGTGITEQNGLSADATEDFVTQTGSQTVETTDNSLDAAIDQSYAVLVGQEGSSALVMIATNDGNVLDGYVTLKIAYAYYAAELGFLVSSYDYVDVPVIGWNDVVIVMEDLSSRPYYDSYFNMTAIYHSYDGTVKGSSSKIVFEPN